MRFASTRVVADDLTRLVAFYEDVTGLKAAWLTEDFAELASPCATLALGSSRITAQYSPGAARGAANASAILEFMSSDVDQDHARLADHVEVVQPPTTMPWGNRSFLLRDPEGTLVNLFTPTSPDARRRYGLDKAV